MKTTIQFALLAAALSLPLGASQSNCLEVAVSVKHAVTAQPANVLEVVEKQLSANPGCECEVVKAAIEASEADAELVASIVETAISISPDQMRLISQCAVAVAPDALGEVQSVLGRLDPNKGETSYSAKSAKSPKEPIDVKPAWNPLDFPGQGPVGPNPGGPGGFPVIPPGLPPTVPPVINPPFGTDTDFPPGNGRPSFPFPGNMYPPVFDTLR